MAADVLESANSDCDSDRKVEAIKIFSLYKDLEFHLGVQFLSLYNELEFYCLLSPERKIFDLEISKNRLNYC